MASVSMTGLNFSGLATGIDTDKIIAGLNKFNQARIDTLKARQDEYTAKQTTFTTLQAKLYSLQTSANQLARSAGGAFDGRKATSSDDTALGVTAGTAAVAGTYTVTVGSVARAHQTASAGFADPNAAIKQGTLKLKVGTGAETTVTVTEKNATLQGLADAINAAGGEVRAAVINDGTATPYRLMLTSAKTGAANTITVSGTLDTGTGADINPVAATLQPPADATVTLGSGGGALTVSSPTNQVTGLIPGVSLNALRGDPGKPLTVTVANDTDAAVKAAQGFVDAYNDVRTFINERSRVGEDGTPGEFLGNRDAAALSDDLADALAVVVPGLNPAANRLSSVGLSFADDGKLIFDSGKLSATLNGQGGATPADVKRLFGLTGQSDNAGVSFQFGGSKTKASGASPYGVEVTAPATRATVIATGPPAGAIIVDPPNGTLLMKLNGISSSGISIPSGTYAPEDLAALLQEKINTNEALRGNAVTVGLDGGMFRITSQQYGSGSSVELTGGTLLDALKLTGVPKGTGTDVAGTFKVNGVAEAATGSGQTLTGKGGNANTDGLAVKVTLPAAGTANLTVGQGLASRLGAVLNKYLDPVNGRFKQMADGYKKNVDDITAQITKQNAMLDEKTAQLQARFTAMESAVNSLKGLQSQLSALVPTMSTK